MIINIPGEQIILGNNRVLMIRKFELELDGYKEDEILIEPLDLSHLTSLAELLSPDELEAVEERIRLVAVTHFLANPISEN